MYLFHYNLFLFRSHISRHNNTFANVITHNINLPINNIYHLKTTICYLAMVVFSVLSQLSYLPTSHCKNYNTTYL